IEDRHSRDHRLDLVLVPGGCVVQYEIDARARCDVLENDRVWNRWGGSQPTGQANRGYEPGRDHGGGLHKVPRPETRRTPGMAASACLRPADRWQNYTASRPWARMSRP